MGGMIRVSQGLHQSAITTKASSRLGISQAPLASLSRAADDPLPGRDDYSPKKKKRKRAD
jgi:hypothetical protein